MCLGKTDYRNMNKSMRPPPEDKTRRSIFGDVCSKERAGSSKISTHFHFVYVSSNDDDSFKPTHSPHKRPHKSILKRRNKSVDSSVRITPDSSFESLSTTKSSLDERKRNVQFKEQVFMRIYCSSSMEEVDANETKSEPGSLWVTDEEAMAYRNEVLALTRNVKCYPSPSSSTMFRSRQNFFTHPMLQFTNEDRFIAQGTKELRELASWHIKRVLVLDRHDIFLKLYVCHMKKLFPHAVVVCAKSCSEAFMKMKELEKESESSQAFDIIIAEERLKIFTQAEKEMNSNSGSAFLQCVTNMLDKDTQSSTSTKPIFKRPPLLIGTSARLSEDCETLTKSGADFLWGKPPPLVDNLLRNTLLTTLLVKRGISDIVIV